MKRFFAFLIVIGIAIGLVVFWKNTKKEENNQNIEIESGEKEVYIGELNLPLIAMDTVNPILTKNKQVSDVMKLIYEPLWDWNEKNQLEPVLVSEWYEKDDLTWILKLNTNARWHDGSFLKAEDVIFTYQTILKEDSVYHENIRNITAIEKIDTNAIQIRLATKDKNLMYLLTFPIISYDFFEKDLKKENTVFQEMGTGPYCLKSISKENGVITLEANSHWWKSKEFKVKNIHLYLYSSYGEAIKAFKSSTIDLITTTMTSWQKKFGVVGINTYSYESAEFETIIPNTQNVLLKENSVRRMILAGINAANIIEVVYQGNGKVSNYPITSNSYLNFYETDKNYDVEKAKQLLMNAGWINENDTWKKEINGKNYSLSFDLLVNEDIEEKFEIAKLIEENLQEIGVKIKIVKVNTKEYQKRLENGNFELALATLYLDSDRDLLELVESTSQSNYARYQNSTMDALIQKMTFENQEMIWQQIQELYRNECPYIGMYYLCNQLLTNKSVKGNIQPTVWNPYYGIMGWCK